MTLRPAKRAYRTLDRFSRKNPRTPEAMASRRNQFSTHRRRFIVFSARRKK